MADKKVIYCDGCGKPFTVNAHDLDEGYCDYCLDVITDDLLADG